MPEEKYNQLICWLNFAALDQLIHKGISVKFQVTGNKLLHCDQTKPIKDGDPTILQLWHSAYKTRRNVYFLLTYINNISENSQNYLKH